jgi:hypothetical protein
MAHHNLSKIQDGTPQNFAQRKGGTKLLHMVVAETDQKEGW